jgi:quinol monooxygenase YgiN
MIKAVFTFDVVPEKQSDYLKATADKIKPYWESHGCQSYQVWQVEGTNTFVKEMYFSDQATKDKTMSSKEAGADAVRKLWRSFVAGDFVLKTHILKVK